MRPIWIIEAGVFGQNAERLRAEVERQGMECWSVRQYALADDSMASLRGEPLAPDDCVICYSTFPFAQDVEARGWKSGAWCSFDNLACSMYYAYFGRYLLNQQYTLLPSLEAMRQREFLYQTFGRNGQVFARPNGVEKLFTGRCVAEEDFAVALAPARYNPTTQVVIAAPQTIGREWRLVVAEHAIVAASQYMEQGKFAVAPGCPKSVREFVQNMLNEVQWRPDPIFMVDVCESNGNLYLLELNSFSCSGLYQCDMAEVVAAASDIAQQTRVSNFVASA